MLPFDLLMKNNFSNITMFDVNRNLWTNLTHWMTKREPPRVEIKQRANEYVNSSFNKGFKSYVKGAYTVAFEENKNNLLDDFKEFYKSDIDFYNTHKSHCYKGGELWTNDM